MLNELNSTHYCILSCVIHVCVCTYSGVIHVFLAVILRNIYGTIRMPGENIDSIQRYSNETHIIVYR